MRALLLLALLAAATPRALAEEKTPGQRLVQAETLDAAGDYDAASKVVNELLVHDTTLPVTERARLYVTKARLEMAYGRTGEMRLWLAKAAATNPALTLDPVKDPPPLLAAWKELAKGRHGAAEKPAAVGGESTGRFLLGLFPLGLGHFSEGRGKDGALFLSTESLLLLAGATLPASSDDGTNHPRARLGTGVALLGAYGYELTDLLPDLARRDPGATAVLRTTLSLFPFGVGQAKNHETVKAVAFGAVDAALLATATLAPDPEQRKAAWTLFGVAWAYGALDALISQPDVETAREDTCRPRFGISPTLVGRGFGAVATVSWTPGGR